MSAEASASASTTTVAASATPDGASAEPAHLLVLIHGMWGAPVHLAEARRIMAETRGPRASPFESEGASISSKQPTSGAGTDLESGISEGAVGVAEVGAETGADDDERRRGPAGERLHILVAETNREDGTYDGIDWGGERVAEEILDKVKELEKEGSKVTRFSVTGYSLGGLIARYVVGILHQRGFFEKVEPVNFNTVATPHIGLPRYPSFISSIGSFFGPKLLSRTGEQFYAVDKWSANGRPLLEVMADPNRIFFQALSRFQHVRIYANSINDVTVPYVTAAIEAEDPFLDHAFNGVTVELDEKYSPVIKTYNIPQELMTLPKVAPLSRDWFKRMKPGAPLLPPALQFSFPYNVLLFLVTPILVPLVLSLVITRLSLASRASRARIKVLEKEESGVERLAHIVARLEREMEDAMVDMFDGDGTEIAAPGSSSEKPGPSSGKTKKGKDEGPKDQPRLLEVQKRMVRWLNSLPGLKKELVFIKQVRNSHAVIIARDVKRFPGHKDGEGVLRHWADHFIM